MSKRDDRGLPPVLPVGTAVVIVSEVRSAAGRVVACAGAMGVVVHIANEAEARYRVRFPGGEEATITREAIEVLSHYQRRGLVEHTPGAELRNYAIYRCVIGSRAYGLDHDKSDVDRRGVYLPPADLQWSLYGVPEQLEDEASQECLWELEKFIRLALKANPNVLEVLWSPRVEEVKPIGERLLEIRGAFLSKLVYSTYNGYVMSQFKKMEQDIRQRGRIKWKHAMHMIRLLLSGITVVQEGHVPVAVSEHRGRLLAIRDGAMPWEELEAWRLGLHAEFDRAFAATSLPDLPDYEKANALLIEARRSMT